MIRTDRDVFKSTAITSDEKSIDAAVFFLSWVIYCIYTPEYIFVLFSWVLSRHSLWTSTTTPNYTPSPSRNRTRCTTTTTTTRSLDCVFKVSPFSYLQVVASARSPFTRYFDFSSKPMLVFFETHHARVVGGQAPLIPKVNMWPNTGHFTSN